MWCPRRRFVLSLVSSILILLSFGEKIPVVEARSVDDDSHHVTPTTRNQPVSLALFADAVGGSTDTTVQPLDGGVTPPTAPLFLVRAKKGGPVVRVGPSQSAAELTGLYYDTYLPVYGQLSDADGVLWYLVRLWG